MAEFSQSALQESIMIITQLPEVEKAKKKKIPRNLGILNFKTNFQLKERKIVKWKLVL